MGITYTDGSICIREFREGKEFGKGSIFYLDEVCYNNVCDEKGEIVGSKKVAEDDEAFFKVGKGDTIIPHMALEADWYKYADMDDPYLEETNEEGNNDGANKEQPN